MADLLTELEGFLGADQVAKLRSNPAALERVSRASEVLSFYDGETETPPAPPVRREAPPTPIVRPASGTEESLTAIMARLDSFGNIDEKIKAGVETVVKARGDELVNNAIAISMRNNRELSKIDAKHRAEFGEDLDDAKLTAHVDAAVAAGRPFRTITDAYDDMTRQARIDKQIATGIESGTREALKVKAAATLPGVSPSGASPMLKQMHLARRPGGAPESGTHVDTAARALEARLAERGEQVA